MTITQKAFKNALEGSGGNQSTIAKRLGKVRSTITMFLNKKPKMRALLDAEAERIIDVAENILDFSITNDKDLDSAKWKLTNSKRGKARGYGPKQELEHSGETHNTTFNLIEKSIEEIKDAKPNNQPKASGNPESPRGP